MADLDGGFSRQKYPGPPLPTPNHIRLVSLLPGNTDTITCELITVDIHSAPHYEALSYTWGKTSDRQAIRIKSAALDQSTELFATSNCVSALRRLRYQHQPRALWVDSLSINQSDVLEKNHQLMLMSKIYSQATNAIIYLGEHANNSDLALDFIAECNDPSPETTSLSYPKSELLLQALDSFFYRPWFTRVWVIQEAFLSNTALVYCGEKTIMWSAIKNFNNWNVTSRWLQQLPFVISASKETLIKSSIESSMLTALNRTRQCSATDQRDKVYALLPLFQSYSEKLDIMPSYADKIAKVYTDCATALLPKCGLKLLSAVQGSSDIEGLPSWVPDWSSPRQRVQFGTPGMMHLEREINRKRTSELPAHILTNSSDNRASLRVAGHLCGKISDMGSTYIAGRGPFPMLEWRSQRCRQIKSIKQINQTINQIEAIITIKQLNLITLIFDIFDIYLNIG